MKKQLILPKKMVGNGGFSLIELAIIMVIAGLMVASALSTFDTYQKRTALNSTLEKANNISLAIGRFVAESGRLPCPADAILPATDPDSGKENCRPGGLDYPILSDIDCEGHCRIQGARRWFGVSPDYDQAGERNGVATVPAGEQDRLLRGVIPYKTLGLALWEAYDGWGTMMTYTVTELMSSSFLVSAEDPPPWGKIRMDDNLGALNLKSWDPATGIDEPQPSPKGGMSAWPFSIISHGPNRKGGWTINGTISIPCEGEGRDIENCDPQSPSFVDAEYIVTADGDNYFDDPVVLVVYATASDKWYYSTVKGIRNKIGNVGIGTETPQVALDISGDVRANNVRGARFCDENDDNCFDPDIIGGDGLHCNGGAMRGIANNTATCSPAINLGSIVPAACAADSYLIGFCATGEIICRTADGVVSSCP